MTGSAPASVRSGTLPLSVGADRRHLVDQSGHAVLIQGDAAWSLIVNTTTATVSTIFNRGESR